VERRDAMRRRLLLALALVVGVFVFPTSASATSYDLLDYQSAVDAMLAVDPTLEPPPNDPQKDFAVGGFTYAQNPPPAAPWQVGMSAHRDGPQAEDAWGHVSITLAHQNGKGRLRVVCLSVLGNKAALGIEPMENSNGLGAGVLVVEDNGLPGGTGDRARFVTSDPQNCELFVAGGGTPIEHGNLLINDASLP
jgi:hypothetical protein